MKLKYKIEQHGTKFYIFGYDRHGNKYDSMWSHSDRDRAVETLNRLKKFKAGAA